jgi:GH25 family lysozyme M1 (1,4-beta-N-acetylmuramidase)
MIRLGSRGYDSGVVELDDNFEANLTNALAAGIDVGIYFHSQAVTVEEAAEEGAYVAAQLVGKEIAYPVVFEMEEIINDSARTDHLNQNSRTDIVKTFLSTVQAAGYTPMIYGNKQWLIEQIELDELVGYDVWLAQPGDLPDYPYGFQMWQYAMDGKINGIADRVDFTISFVDYAAR